MTSYGNAARSVILLLLFAGLSGCATAGEAASQEVPADVEADGPASQKTPEPVVDDSQHGLVHAMEIYSSRTRSDWEAYADAVVVVRVTDERRIEPSEPDATGEGEFNLVGRQIDLDVTQIIWVYEGVEAELGDQITLEASGWFEDSERAIEIAVEGRSRLETGHQYVLALKWYAEEIANAWGDVLPARWGLVGSGGTLPADGDIIGVGEYQGVDSAEIDPSMLREGSLLAEHMGDTVEEFIAALDGFERVEREPVIPLEE
ncbi:MAG: hypothetical protein QM606_08905 [Leucobacter sp.]